MLKFKKQFKTVLAMLLIAPSFCLAEGLHAEAYKSQLEQYIAIVNDTKQILDEQQNTSPKQQKEALCQRIDAYQGILALTEQFPNAENSQMMHVIAQNYLNQQMKVLQTKGMTEQAFCVGKNQALHAN